MDHYAIILADDEDDLCVFAEHSQEVPTAEIRNLEPRTLANLALLCWQGFLPMQSWAERN